jgi:hypothetical protein
MESQLDGCLRPHPSAGSAAAVSREDDDVTPVLLPTNQPTMCPASMSRIQHTRGRDPVRDVATRVTDRPDADSGCPCREPEPEDPMILLQRPTCSRIAGASSVLDPDEQEAGKQAPDAQCGQAHDADGFGRSPSVELGCEREPSGPDEPGVDDEEPQEADHRSDEG